MQCEACSNPATVHITEVRAGKCVARNFCRQHAAGDAGVPEKAGEWEPFIGWIVAHFKEHSTLPTAAEISQQGEIGARMATLWQDRDGVFEEIRHTVQKRIGGLPWWV
jgi:hypothetical protein